MKGAREKRLIQEKDKLVEKHAFSEGKAFQHEDKPPTEDQRLHSMQAPDARASICLAASPRRAHFADIWAMVWRPSVFGGMPGCCRAHGCRAPGLRVSRRPGAFRVAWEIEPQLPRKKAASTQKASRWSVRPSPGARDERFRHHALACDRALWSCSAKRVRKRQRAQSRAHHARRKRYRRQKPI